jgi:DNA-binding PadR family transcriptional regulator
MSSYVYLKYISSAARGSGNPLTRGYYRRARSPVHSKRHQHSKPAHLISRIVYIDVYIICIDVDNIDSQEMQMTSMSLGEFEHLVLLAILQLGDDGYALSILHELDERAGRRVSRGALYKTLERLEDKRFLSWTLEEATPGRGGHPRRRFEVTRKGIAALRTSRDTLYRLWHGLDAVLGRPET